CQVSSTAFSACIRQPNNGLKSMNISVDSCPGAFGADLICSSVNKSLLRMSHSRFYLLWPTTA
ncbi:unnamed protein product, partial [Ectocarpus sp. 13 AM-2016]